MCDTEQEFELTLADIHLSIETTLLDIKRKQKEVDSELSDFKYLKRLTTNVLEPLIEKSDLSQISTVDHVKVLLNVCTRRSSTSSVTSSRMTSSSGSSSPEDQIFTYTSSGICTSTKSPLDGPRFSPRPPENSKTRSAQLRMRRGLSSNALLPININSRRNGTLPPLPRYSNTKQSIKSPSPPCTKPQQIISIRRRSLRPRNELVNNIGSKLLDDVPDIKRIEITRFVEDIENSILMMQEMFSSFTQRVLVPLQTFCKQNYSKATPAQCNRNINNTDLSEKQTNGCLEKTEFRIVQTMNQIRQLLWPCDSLQSDIFSKDGVSHKISTQLDCDKFPVIRVVPDLLQKFDDALLLASTWLKCDKFFVQNAKTALQRAHQRYQKTEQLCQQAKTTQIRLCDELEDVDNQQRSHTNRLMSLKCEIKQLTHQLQKLNESKETLDEKLQDTKSNIGNIRMRHCAARKGIQEVSSKLEDRDRSHGFLEARVLSLKADREALIEKLRINENYVNNIQSKMEDLYEVRDVSSKRYEEKTDPDKLQWRLRQAKLRIPLLELQEKHFTFKTGMEDIRQSLDEVEKGTVEINYSSTPLSNSSLSMQWKPCVLPLPEIPVGRRFEIEKTRTKINFTDDITESSLSFSDQSDDSVS